MMKQIDVSVILVNYRTKKELFACLYSLLSNHRRKSIEIIVVDNDEKETLKGDLSKRFPFVIYIKNKNKGFSQANNRGAVYAKGKFLFFLNPDTVLLNNAINKLVTYLKTHKNVGVVAPLLFDSNNRPYPLQGSRILTPLRSLFAFSFISRLFPNNKILREYWLRNWKGINVKKVEVVPGTALLVRREIFQDLGGFDENFFLYFEENDFCKRIVDTGLKVAILPQAKIFHAWGISTKKTKLDLKKIFNASRFYYFKKHFGLLQALLAEAVLRLNKYIILLVLLIGLGMFLRTTELERSMIFIGDQAWFYLSARDMVMTGQIPLVGIPSSHPWLHQGALWTYLLGGVLGLFHFNPISGAYLAASLDAIAIILLFHLGKVLFSQRVGFIAALFYTISPLVILNSRMPYHTSPIPLAMIGWLYFLYLWVLGKKLAFPVVIFCLGILYNLELATFPLTIVVGIIFLYGLMKKNQYVTNLFDKKIIFLSLIGFVSSMLPMLLYDITHGFPQTVKFLAWVGYKILVVVGYPPLHPSTPSSIWEIVTFLSASYSRLIFPYNDLMAISLFIASIISLFVITLKKRTKALLILSVTTVILFIAFFAARTASEAYLPMFFPPLLLSVGLLVDRLLRWQVLKIPVWILIGGIVFANVYYLVSHHFVLKNDYDTFSRRMVVSNYIVKESKEKEYNLKGEGEGSQFESFTMNYEYLTWWLGHGPSKEKENLQFIIVDNTQEISVRKEIR